MTKLILALGFKQCKSDINMYYFIYKETRELVLLIIYVNNICFISSKDFLFFTSLRIEVKIHDEIRIL